jgi:hypothetical protein
MQGSGRASRLIAVISVGLAATAAAPFSGRVAHAAPTDPGFGQPTPSGIVGDGFEQDVALDDINPNQHIVYSSAPVGTTTGISNIWRSLDGGQTFKFIPATIAGDTGGHPLTCPAGGGDSELAVDAQRHLYFADLYLGNFSVGRSDDQGTTFAPTPSCQGVPTDTVVDRQWYTTMGDPTNGGAVFLVYDRFLQAETVCPGLNTPFTGNALVMARSPVFPAPGSTAGNTFTPSLVLSCDEGIMGNDAFFDYPCTQGPNCSGGQSPEVFVIQDNANLNSVSMNRCDVVAESTAPPQGLTNCVHKVISSFPSGATGASFPTMAIDDQGNLFAVWEQAPVDVSGNVMGDTDLLFSTSSDEGNTWTPAKAIPTPGVHQHVFAWTVAGDPGRIDVSYIGTPTAWKTGDVFGPDSVQGDWSAYMAQTLNNGATWTNQLVSEHFIFRGAVQTLLGGKNGNRDLGDFFKVALGPQGEANISYADDNNPNYNNLNPQAFFVRQNSGTGLYATRDFGAGPGMVNLPAAPTGPCVNDTATNDATFDSADVVGPNNPNLDIVQGCMTSPDASNYRITMQVADLSSLGPDASAGGNTNIWQAQWHVPSTTDPKGGALFMAYAESVSGGAATCWVGQASEFNAEITYPGTTQLPASDCQVNQGAGTITITVPKADVSEPNPIDNNLYAVAFSSQTVVVDAETNPEGLIGGQLPNLIDPLPAFDLRLSPGQSVPELPWAPTAVIAGTVLTVLLVRRRSARRTPQA